MPNFKMKNLILVVISVIVAIGIALIPPPEGLTVESMRYLGIFVAMLVLLISNAVPSWASSLGACAAIVACGVAKISVTFSSFAGSVVWLMIGVFAFSVAVINSGLMTRLAILLLELFPKNYFGQVLSIAVVGLVLSPMIPSSNAKTNLLVPMATEMTKVVGYEKKGKPALGLFTGAFMPPYVCSYAFLTGNANVPYMIGIMGLSFSWMSWLQLTWLWMIIIFALTLVFCFTYCKPQGDQVRNLPETYYKDKLKELGPWTKQEVWTLIIVLVALVLWITQSMHGIDAGMVCIFAVFALALIGVITTKEFTTKVPWGIIMFIGALISIAALMSTTGVSTWLAGILTPVLGWSVSNVWIFVPVVCILTWILRAIIPANGVVLVIVFAIFSGLIADAGISTFVLCFVCYVVANIWFNSFMNPFVIATLGIAGNEYVTIKEFKKTAYAYMVMSIIAMMASIPVWSLCGMC